MWKWLVLFVLLAGGGFVAYDGYMAGLHARPAMPDGAFSISYRNGLRAILVDVPNEQETRRYFGIPLDVPLYLQDAWSYCRPPTKEEGAEVAVFMQERDMPGERFEAVCKLTVDDDTVTRGLVTSVPKL